MAAPSAKTRSKVVLNPSRISPNSLPIPVISRLVLSNVLLCAALDAGKEWLLGPDTQVGVFWTLIRVLACAGLGVLVLEGFTGELGKRFSSRVEWPVLGVSSLLLFIQQACLLTALYRISATRVILFANFASFWMQTLVVRDSSRKTAALVLATSVSMLSDMNFTLSNIRQVIPGYAVFAIYGLATIGLNHTQGVLSPALGVKATGMASILGATVIALPFYIFKSLVYERQESPAIPFGAIFAIPALSFASLYLTPTTHEKIRLVSLPSQYFTVSYMSTVVPALILGALAFSQFPSWTDCIVSFLLYYGCIPDPIQASGGPPKTPASRLAKTYLKTILSNPESRKIFYFLVLNLAYMLVQMLYGVWTNSLGLISDAIHMAFDCMAIAMGLFASVMATWPPNERFTYGYGRIETMSGFANGIFLILISIFIVFEAIQRILNPPEMNTSQLLLVSTLGLAVNLFGMFAMGGHHHHGHSHSHGNDAHSHGHGHSHAVHDEHSHSHGHEHSHSPHQSLPSDHDHPHSHSHSPSLSTFPNSHPSSPHDHLTSTPLTSSSIENHHNGHLLPQPHTPSTAPPTQTRFHSRSQSLQIPFGEPPLLQPSHSLQSGSGSPLASGTHSHSNRHTRTPSMLPSSMMTPDMQSPASPLTPSYKFGHDTHFAEHHDHSHGGERVPNLHDHSHSHTTDHEGHSHNMRGVFLHVMADTLGSVGVIISTLLIQFYGWTGFDPIASLFIAILIAASVIPLVIDSGKVLCLDVDHREDSIKDALDELPMIEGLASFSSPRFWPKDSSSLIGSIHIQIEHAPASLDPTGVNSSAKPVWASVERVVERVDTILRNRISGLEELTIQVEGSNYR